MSAPRAPVVVVGDLMVDVVATIGAPLAHASDTAAEVRWTGGGAAANVAFGLATAGVAVTLVCRVGDDLAGRAAVAELAAAGVDVRAAVDDRRATGTCVVLIDADGERTMAPDRGANAALAPEDLPAGVFAAGGRLHLSGYALLHEGSRPAALAALAGARAAGMTISVDPASAAPLRACGPAAFLGWLGRIDLLLPNLDEATALTGLDDPEAAARALLGMSSEVVVTLGADGALWTDGRRVERAQAPAAAVADATGAGDAFAAAWLAARIEGADPARALEAAASAGSRAVSRVGAR